MTPIYGQSRPLQIISNALRSGRLHHAWIFAGPRGVGKFTTAVALARLILDPERSDMDFRDTAEGAVRHPDSRVQALIDAGTHPDLHVIRKELALFSDNQMLRERKLLNIPLDLLRERVLGGRTGDDRMHDAPAYRTAVLGHGKVFIIDEAELLAAEGQNAMLKTLEEPPPHTYFFLITSQPDRLLSTIRSRSQLVRFNRLDRAAMKQWMTKHPTLSAQNAAIVTWIAQFADGSPGIAQLALEYGFYEWHVALTPMLAELESGAFPVGLGSTMGELVEQFAQAWVKAHGERNTSKDAANKDGARHVFSLLASHARTRLVQVLEEGADPAFWMAAADSLREAELALDSNVNLKLLLENLAVQWTQQTRLVAAS